MHTRKRKFIVTFIVVIIVLLFLIPFGLAAMIYEDNFGDRYETYAPMARSIDEFVGLNMQKHTFTSNREQKLVGYKYYRNLENIKGVVVISHGLGGGGHNSYMDVADYFASNGYVVFAYDATGNDESEGSSVKGIPQGLIDLDYAIQYVKQTSDFDDLPIMLFGHSWGGYSDGSVLNLHPDVKAIVMVAGFNKSMDIIEEEGKKIAGDGISILLPYISLYEKIKLGRYASYNCINGFENTEAGVMIIHSADDEMISQEKGFDVFYDHYKNNHRFSFVKYEDRGHDYIYYSDRSREYKEEFNRKSDEYFNSLDEEFTSELKESYLNDNLDKKILFDLDEELMNSMVKFYDNNIN
ncbi:alpha/beta hydrolase family protein [Oceanobacillus halophilus]|uniref:Alpha/beta fold hydrolase n=1 Tax=Oceanobacillus halophilus TaxID=930130 RepID=A0A494ZUZ1_9BACI|nr:alpha/beta fold hydrolase [Oceanobacillus halophilus]RKQ30231.1 alpha/beta fold hydrolase [Oceanobacillus halophilus]